MYKLNWRYCIILHFINDIVFITIILLYDNNNDVMEHVERNMYIRKFLKGIAAGDGFRTVVVNNRSSPASEHDRDIPIRTNLV